MYVMYVCLSFVFFVGAMVIRCLLWSVKRGSFIQHLFIDGLTGVQCTQPNLLKYRSCLPTVRVLQVEGFTIDRATDARRLQPYYSTAKASLIRYDDSDAETINDGDE